MEQARIPQRYTLIEQVGQGGMAIVYRAHDESLKREVAIKILHQHLAADPESRARLQREAQAVAKLRHDNILEIFDYSGADAQSAYIVTEFIAGQTLKQFLAGRALRFPEQAALIAIEVCAALAHAHAVGIIHRDVKPENVMIRSDGLIKLMDFGIAQMVDLQRMTVTGQLLGSPAYMAPEVIEGKPLDFRTDVFSVGIMLYLLATGALPFSGKNPHEVLRRITEGRFADPRAAARGVDEALARIITRALARRPDDRYPDVGLLRDDLRGYLAEAGLADVRHELRALFADPAAYEAALPARLQAALIASASDELAAGRSAKAIELWGRVLGFDPNNPTVAAQLRRLEGRARLRAIAGIACAAGLCVAGGLAVAHHVRAPVTAPPPAPAAAALPPPLPVPRPFAAPEKPAGAAAVATHRMSTAARQLAAAATRDETPATSTATALDDTGAPPVSRTFTLGPTPQNVDVYLDGARQFGYDVDHKTISVPWTSDHTIEFRSPAGCCFVERVDVGPNRPLPPDSIIARRLKWRPAHLLVSVEPAASAAAARVLVRDPNHNVAPSPARPGEDIDVPFFPDDESIKEIEIAVDAGDAFATERVQVRAGQRLKQVVKLKPGGD